LALNLEELNRPQRDAVTTLSGPLLVLAGAGTGKTRVITFRIARLIQTGTLPHRILAVTFTNKAAKEMRERAQKILGRRKRGDKPPEISTFHSLCVRMLRRHARKLGYPEEFTIYDRGDQEMLARNALRDVRVGHETLKPADLLSYVGNWKSQGVRADSAFDAAAKDKEQLAAMAYGKYQQALKAAGAMDFDDLLLCTEELFSKHPDARFSEASRFDHLLIDEYQDTNGLQYRIVKALADRHRNLCVVGDDDQSIYGWRGAEVTHILSFQNDWPEAKIVRLEDNYRSKAEIIQLANTLIAHNSTRHKKVLRAYREGGIPPKIVRFDNETAEAEEVVRDIRTRLDVTDGPRTTPSDIAILFRTNEQPRAFELELRRHKVPYVLVGGMSFYDRKEVRDVMSYLRIIANPNDEVSLLRVINVPSRGIGAGTIEALLERAVSAGKPLWQVLPDALRDIPTLTAQRIFEFIKLIDLHRSRLGTQPLAEMMKELLTTVDYKSELTRAYKDEADVEARWKTVEELINSAALYTEREENPTLLGFLEEATLADRDDKDDKDKKERHALTLMTLHSAKGLEFPHVYLIGMEEGLLPHQRSIIDGRSIEEERRLCYVGVTRAQDTLVLSFCRERMKWGKPRPSIPSRFLMEMRGETERAKRAAEAAHAMFTEAAKMAELAEKAAAAKKPKKKRAS
jgi:DNA helicase II / ATP-dependent DNA helicase PcrA